MRGTSLPILLAIVLAGCHPRADDLPEVAVADAKFMEHTPEGPVVRFRVTISRPPQLPVIVRYATQNGTAQADREYRPASGILVFTEHRHDPQAIDVTLIGMAASGGGKNFALVLSDALNATLASRRATAKIL